MKMGIFTVITLDTNGLRTVAESCADLGEAWDTIREDYYGEWFGSGLPMPEPKTESTSDGLLVSFGPCHYLIIEEEW